MSLAGRRQDGFPVEGLERNGVNDFGFITDEISWISYDDFVDRPLNEARQYKTGRGWRLRARRFIDNR